MKVCTGCKIEKELDKFLATMVGSTQKVLLENGNIGRCENFVQVKLSGMPLVNIGEIFEVQIIGKNNGQCLAVIPA